MKKIKSSFLYIYKLQENSLYSIIQRISGIFLFVLLILYSINNNIIEYIYLKLINYKIYYYYLQYQILINLVIFIIIIYFLFLILIHILCGIKKFIDNDKFSYNDIVLKKHEI